MEPDDILKLPGWYKLNSTWWWDKKANGKNHWAQDKYFHQSNTKWGVWFVGGKMRFWYQAKKVKVPIPDSLEAFQEVIKQYKPATPKP